jgi:biotin carboxyl carrier protein
MSTVQGAGATVLELDKGNSQMVRAALPPSELHTLYSEFVALAGAETDRTRFLMNLVQRIVGVTGALGGVFFVRDADNDLAFGPRLLSRELMQTHGDINSTLATLARKAVNQRHASTEVLADDPHLQAVMVPVLLPDSASEVFCLVVRARDMQPFVALLQLACGYVNFWNQARQAEQLDFEAEASASLVELITRVQQADDAESACLVLANELTSLFRADRAAVGTVRRASGQCRLRAVSETSRFDHRNKLSRALEGVFSETGGIGEPGVWPSNADFQANTWLAHRKLQNLTGAASVVSAPMHDSNDQLVAVVVLWWMGSPPDTERCRRMLSALDQPLGACLELQDRASRPGLGRRRGGFAARGWRKLAIGIGAIAGMALLALPVPHRIDAGLVVSPITQRVVSAPFAGIVETSQVKVGDVVNVDDPLARFDGREFGWRADELRTEHDRLGKQRDVSLADGDAGEAQIAALEMKRVELRISLLENQMRQLEIRAPISGVVLADALEQREGSPVEKGQALYEIAPLDRLQAEVEVPVREISHVAPGARVTLGVDAFPDRTWEAELAQILPRAEVRDGHQVFVSRIALHHDIEGPMPGMRGHARLHAGDRALGWVLFHRPWEALRQWSGWVDVLPAPDDRGGEAGHRGALNSSSATPAPGEDSGEDPGVIPGVFAGVLHVDHEAASGGWWATFVGKLRSMREQPSNFDGYRASAAPESSQ